MTASPPRHPLPVSLLGATGSVGQRFVTLLHDHPWFKLVAVTASERSAGRPYHDAVNWVQSTPLPPVVGDMIVGTTEPVDGVRLAFSALDASIAGSVETACAEAGQVVVSNARNHRMDPDVPLVVPEVNPDHLALIDHQRFGAGAIITNPNCSTIGLVMALKPLHDAFGLRMVNVVTMQALSGAGLPGVPSFQIADNVIPFISGEEDKLESETKKILGVMEDGTVRPSSCTVSAQCNRVPVLDGHTECVSVSLDGEAKPAAIREAWDAFVAAPQRLGLPTAPERPVRYLDAPDAPQPRLHRDLDGGMAAIIGRLRPCPIFGYKFVVLSHNTLRGAAGGAVLLAELAVAEGVTEIRPASAGL